MIFTARILGTGYTAEWVLISYKFMRHKFGQMCDLKLKLECFIGTAKWRVSDWKNFLRLANIMLWWDHVESSGICFANVLISLVACKEKDPT